MATPRQALMCPIEITTDCDTITISAVDYTIDAKVYPNMLAVLAALKATALSDAYLSSNFRVCLTTSSGTAALTRTALSDMLGFDGTETGATRTATHAPWYCWGSTHQHNTSAQWVTDSDDEFHGSMSADGNLHGVTMSSRETLLYKWQWETAANVYPAAAVNPLTDYTGSYVTFPEQKSCFWAVVTQSRKAHPIASTSGNVSPKGLYFFPNISMFLGSSPIISVATWDSGGTVFYSTAGSDTYVFCTADAPKPPPASNDGLLSYYDVDVKLTSAVAPLWD